MASWLHDGIAYGYAGLAISLFLSVIGLPVPGTTLLVVGGVMIARHEWHWLPVAGFAAVGTLGGMAATYVIGYRAGRALLGRYGARIGLTPPRLAVLERWFERFGGWIVALGFFSANTRRFTGYLAGIHRMPMLPFGLFSAAGTIAWIAVVLWLGRYVGAHWATWDAFVGRWGPIGGLIGGIATFAVIAALFVRQKYAR